MDKVKKSPTIIDGTDTASNNINPSLPTKEELDEMEDLNVKPMEDDEDEEDDESNVDDEDDDETNEEELPPDEDSDKGEVKPEIYQDEIEPSQEYKEVQLEQRNIARQLERVNSIYDLKPQMPKDQDDDRAMQRYERQIDDWDLRMRQTQIETKKLQGDLRGLSAKAEQLFFEDHPDIPESEKKALYNFVGGKEAFKLEFLAGEMSLNELYELYKIKVRKSKKDQDKIKQLKRDKAKIKPVKIKGGASGDSTSKGSNGFLGKFKYANKPEFKEYVTYLKKKKVGLDGERLTAKKINDLCRQEWNLMRGNVPI